MCIKIEYTHEVLLGTFSLRNDFCFLQKPFFTTAFFDFLKKFQLTVKYMTSNHHLFFLQPISVSDSSTYSTPLSWAEQNGVPTGAECTICYENPIDAVLYMCGHMCMCYDCARQQWRGKGGGHCPLCRAVIRDVIRTYKS